MNELSLNNISVDEIILKEFQQKNISVDVLRLDKIHPQISGNKWFKLKEYLCHAQRLNKRMIITFGGAFSNHIHATAAACKELRLQSAGIIRGEEPKVFSPTLLDAAASGMKLFFVSREAYRQKQIPAALQDQYEDAYIINEGGYGVEGMQGARNILSIWNNAKYTHICAAVGTGTTLSGLITSAMPHQQVIGFSVLKNNFDVEKDVQLLIGASYSFSVQHDFHFGRYAKSPPQLLQFMNDWFVQTRIPSDFVYTGKLFYAVHHLIESSFFPPDSKLLIIHSGGLQGNRSLPKDKLIF